MKLQIVINHCGKAYEGKPQEVTEIEYEAIAEQFYETANELKKLKFPLVDGGYLVVGSKVIEESVLHFRKIYAPNETQE